MSDDPLNFPENEWWPIQMPPDPFCRVIYDQSLRWKNNACCPVRILEWAQLASHVTPTTYPELISLIISRAFFPYFSKGTGCRLITLEIWLRILSADPPWLIIRLKRAIADGKKAYFRNGNDSALHLHFFILLFYSLFWNFLMKIAEFSHF